MPLLTTSGSDKDEDRIRSLLLGRDRVYCSLYDNTTRTPSIETITAYPRTRYHFTPEGRLTHTELFTETGILDPLDLL